MALKDVNVTIDLKKTSGLLGFGKPLIIGVLAGGRSYKEYASLEEVKVDFDGTVAEADDEIKKIYNMAEAIFSQEHKPKTIGIACSSDASTSTGEDGTTTAGPDALLSDIYDNDFYFVLSTTENIAVMQAIAEVVETNGRKMYVTQVSSDVDMAQLSEGGYERTVLCFHAVEGENMAAALVGECGSQEVGSITWKFKNLKGITAELFTETELENLHNAGAIAYVTKAGDDQTSEGIVVDGEYIDVVHAKDYVQFNIEYKVQKLFNKASKVPYTNNGIAMIESEVINVLQASYNSGIIAEDDNGNALYSTKFPKRSEVAQVDRASRQYNIGTFEFELAGAIHTAKIQGSIIV